MKITHFLATCGLGLLGACATPYQPTGFSGGFESNWIGPDVLSVDVRGNGFSSDALIKDYSLLQAAEKAREAGYSHFTTLDVADMGKTNTYFSSSGGDVSAQSVYKPRRGLVVRMYKGAPPGYQPGQYYVVADILSTLGAKYIK